MRPHRQTASNIDYKRFNDRGFDSSESGLSEVSESNPSEHSSSVEEECAKNNMATGGEKDEGQIDGDHEFDDLEAELRTLEREEQRLRSLNDLKEVVKQKRQ